jgi:hypothetical protein
MDLIDLAQGRDQWRALVKTVMNLRVPQNDEKFLNGCTVSCFSRRAQLRGVSYISRILYESLDRRSAYNKALSAQGANKKH